MTNDLRGTTSTVKTWCLYIEQDRLDRRRRVRCQRVGGRTTMEDTLDMSLQREYILVYLANVSSPGYSLPSEIPGLQIYFHAQHP
jgi:hypothetical protein